jgi:MFS family permease
MFSQVLALGLTQTVAWASSTYLIAIIARPAALDLGIPQSAVFGAFSLALVVMGFAGPACGRAIDSRGGRGVLVLSNVVLASGLALLACVPNAALLFVSWVVIGVGMAMGLYDAAFATLVRIHGPAARAPITGITLIAGFASTVGWPLTAMLTARYGWRPTCIAWAALHLVLALPLNLHFIPAARGVALTPSVLNSASAGRTRMPRGERRAFVLLTMFASTAAFVTSAMAAHLPGLLLAVGATSVAALAAAALVGPAQVAARLVEFVAAQRLAFHPLVTARIAVALHPIGALLLIAFGGVPAAASLFALLHGAGNGMVTIARGTLPLAIFGAEGYGERQGLIGVAARVMQALAPFAFGLVLERHGATAALALTVAFSIAALVALVALKPERR